MKLFKHTGNLILSIFLCAPLFAVSIGDKAPPFSLSNINGETQSLEEASGKIVFVNFWASWCPPCHVEFPELNQLAKEFKKEDLMVLAINIDTKKTNVTKFLKKLKTEKPSMEILLDPTSDVVAQYEADAMPTSFIIDTKGIVRHIHEGFRKEDPQKWRKEIKNLLEED